MWHVKSVRELRGEGARAGAVASAMAPGRVRVIKLSELASSLRRELDMRCGKILPQEIRAPERGVETHICVCDDD